MIVKNIIRHSILISVFVSLAGCTVANTDHNVVSEKTDTNGMVSVDTSAHIDVLKIDPDNAFHATNNVMRDVNSNLSRALRDNKLSMIVVGANWCHDSVGLAKKFQDPEVAKTLNQHYEVSYVDAGFLTNAYGVAQRFGLPIYFATPTVFIINPKTEKLVNGADMHQWKDAYLIPVEDYRTYFADYAKPEARNAAPHKVSLTPTQLTTLNPLLASIDAFEAKQVARVKAGYKKLSPVMAQRKDGKFPPELGSIWVEVRKVRWTLPDDMAVLRKSATDQVLAGKTNIKLEFPDYGKYSWE